MKSATLSILLLLVGCQAPLAQLTFPYRALRATTQPRRFDVDRDGRDDFAVTFDASDRMDALEYDDDEDGSADRTYRLRNYANDDLPHVIILLDSVPFQCLADRYAAGEFRWFDAPAKVIAPFPSMTEVCYTEVLHAAPMAGMIDQYYDRKRREIHRGMASRFFGGFQYPWERYLHYRSAFREEGFAYLSPRPWFAAELERARRAIDDSPDRTTIVYLTSASGMACKYGRAGIDEVLDGAAQLCLQLLYERRGAIRITLMADHGHNLVESQNIDVAAVLRSAGFRPHKQLDRANDVVLESNGLVTYAAVRTTQPARVADALLKHPGIELATYMTADAVIIRSPSASAAIEQINDNLRYRSIDGDPLNYGGEKTLSRLDWFSTTVDHAYPDGPPRLWDAFHRLVRDPPDVMFTTRNGYMAGDPSFERYIKMKSTHGSLDQINSATFVITMHAPPLRPMRSREVMKVIEPNWKPGVVRR
jgi:hypothetical protein